MPGKTGVVLVVGGDEACERQKHLQRVAKEQGVRKFGVSRFQEISIMAAHLLCLG